MTSMVEVSFRVTLKGSSSAMPTVYRFQKLEPWAGPLFWAETEIMPYTVSKKMSLMEWFVATVSPAAGA